MRCIWKVSVCVLSVYLLTILNLGCSKSTPSDDEKHPPSIAEVVSPSNQSIIQFTTEELKWVATDPNGLALDYTVFFGTTDPPAMISSHQLESTYYLTGLEYNQVYYWRVIVRNSDSDSSVSPVWSFETSAEPHWTLLGDGLTGVVISLSTYQGQLLAGGHLPDHNHLAVWSGSAWTPFGDGIDCSSTFNCAVSATVEYEGQLVIGGDFDGAGDVSSPDCAFWNGNQWIASGMNFEHVVRNFMIHEQLLYACSSFWYYNGIQTGGVLSWDGLAWMEVGTGIRSGQVKDIILYNDRLVICGDLGAVPQIRMGLAQLEGNLWNKVGPDVSGEVEALCTYEGKLIAGGSFVILDTYDTPAEVVGAWDGVRWKSMGDWPYGTVYALLVHKGRLFAAGEFEYAGEVEAHNIAVWDGHNWSPIGSGFDGEVRTLCEYNGQLIVGGFKVASWGL